MLRMTSNCAGWTLRDDAVRVVSVNLGLSHETTWQDPANRERFRLGAGAIVMLGY